MNKPNLHTIASSLDTAILHHVDLYKLTIEACVAKTLMPDQTGAHISPRQLLQSLVDRKKLCVDQFPSGEKYYTRHGISRPPNTQTIDYDLATLWLCFMEPESRFYRIETTELRSMMPHPPHHHVRHVIGEHDDGSVVYRVYPTAVDVKTTLKRLKHFIAELRNKQRLGDWLDNGDYGFAICCETDQKATQLAEMITSKRSDSRLADEARIVVATTPTSETVGKGVRA